MCMDTHSRETFDPCCVPTPYIGLIRNIDWSAQRGPGCFLFKHTPICSYFQRILFHGALDLESSLLDWKLSLFERASAHSCEVQSGLPYGPGEVNAFLGQCEMKAPWQVRSYYWYCWLILVDSEYKKSYVFNCFRMFSYPTYGTLNVVFTPGSASCLHAHVLKDREGTALFFDAL